MVDIPRADISASVVA